MKYDKPHLTLDQQIAKITSNGMIVDHEPALRRELLAVGYYRLSGYWYHWREVDGDDKKLDTFSAGTNFQNIRDIYSFDRRLRLIVMEAIERIEVSMRVHIAYVLGARSQYAHLEESCLGDRCKSIAPKERPEDPEMTYLEQFAYRQSKHFGRSEEDFKNHFRDKYDNATPVWVAVELWDFGMLRDFMSLVTPEDKSEIAGHLGLPGYKSLGNWMEVLCDIRNIAAHHGRLFNRKLTKAVGKAYLHEHPDLSHLKGVPDDIKWSPYPALALIRYLMRFVAPDSDWDERMLKLFDEFPTDTGAGLECYGFLDGWKSLPIWQRSDDHTQ